MPDYSPRNRSGGRPPQQDDGRGAGDGDQGGGPPHAFLTTLAAHAWDVGLLLAIAALLAATGSGLDNPITVALGTLLLLVLTYQAGFLLYYPGAAADRGVILPLGNTGRTVVESRSGVGFVVLADAVLVTVILVGAFS